MGKIDNQPKISRALQNFTGAVPVKVSNNNGFLIYAGGDDVLAILPLENALQCAADIRQFYQNAFIKEFSEDKYFTISAAIEFAHTHTPLTSMLKDAHYLLDKVAKDRCGREAVAVRVWKRGGKALEWAMPWKIALDKNNQVILEKLKQQFLDKDNIEAAFSSKFFYKIRERFELLNPAQQEQEVISENDAKTLLAVDYLASGVNEMKYAAKKNN